MMLDARSIYWTRDGPGVSSKERREVDELWLCQHAYLPGLLTAAERVDRSTRARLDGG